MTREEAIALAKRCAVAQPHSYMGATIEDCMENFMPHEWVIEAILQAANGEPLEQLVGLRCPLCKEPQINSPSGPTCSNGHGGLEGEPV